MNLTTDPFLSIALAAATLVAISCSCAAQNPAGEPKTAPRDGATTALLAKIAAARGKPADDKDISLAIEGTYTVTFEGAPEPLATGPFREFYLGPDLMRSTSEMDYGAMENGVTKDLAWAIDPSMGAKVLRGPHAAAARRQGAFVRGARPEGLYKEIVRAGTHAIDGVEHSLLRMTPAEGKPDLWYVTAEGVVARIDASLPVPESADAVWDLGETMDSQFVFADWREVDGVRYPFRRSLRMGPMTLTFVSTRVDPKAKIDRAVFTPPEAVTKIEHEPVQPAFGPDGKPNYQVLERKAQPVASIRVKCKPAEISATLAMLLPEVIAHLSATGAKMAGPPFSRYHAFSETEIDLEAGIPVTKSITPKDRIRNSELPAGRTVTAWHFGPYEQLAESHAALRAHLTASKMKARGGPWEVYWTDPGVVPDPKKWRTQLFVPIE